MTDDEQEHDRTILICTERLDVCPDDVIALTSRGQAWYEKKNYDKAIGDFDQALMVNADCVDARTSYTCKALYGRGLSLSKQHDHDLAIRDFTEAIHHGDSDKALARIFYNRGRCRRLTGAHDAAIDDFTQAIRLDQQYTLPLIHRGFVWQDRGDYRKAIAEYNLAIRKNPRLADAYHNRGNAWVYLGKLRRGIADFTRAIQLDPNSVATHDDPKSAATYHSRGVAWRRKGKYAKALADYEQALELDPHSAKRRAPLCALLAGCPQRRYRNGARALELITESCEITGYSDAKYYDLLAAAHAEQGDFASAIAVQKEALTLATEDDDNEGMRYCLELYEAGEPWRIESPNWCQRWA